MIGVNVTAKYSIINEIARISLARKSYLSHCRRNPAGRELIGLLTYSGPQEFLSARTLTRKVT